MMRLPVPTAELLGEPAPPRGFGDPASLPEELHVPGFDVRPVLGPAEGPGTVSLRPLMAEPDYHLTCYLHDPATGGYDHCRLVAPYPPAPEVTINAIIPLTRPFQEFAPDVPAIVARLREIALCLDVTETPPADPEAALAALLAGNPTLSGCEERLAS